jgi:hypothetical protein
VDGCHNPTNDKIEKKNLDREEGGASSFGVV